MLIIVSFFRLIACVYLCTSVCFITSVLSTYYCKICTNAIQKYQQRSVLISVHSNDMCKYVIKAQNNRFATLANNCFFVDSQHP